MSISRRHFLGTASRAALAACVADSQLSLAQAMAPPTAATPGPGLKDLVAHCGRLIGAWVDKWQIQDPRREAVLLKNFNLITLGKLKWGFLRPDPTTFTWAETDWVVSWAQQHGMTVHGHNLIWNSSNPAWLTQTLTKANAQQMMTDHINALMKRYAGKVSSWDVVNEPTAANQGRPDGLYKGPWLDVMGPEYIDAAFHIAAAADPKSLRVLNTHYDEQSGEYGDRQRGYTLTLIKQLVARKVPVQVIGMEAHLLANLSSDRSQNRDRFVKEIRDLGLPIYITELDIDDSSIQGDFGSRDNAVAKSYREFLTSIVETADPKRISFFCVDDKRNWYDGLKNSRYEHPDGTHHRPGLLDENVQMKAAFTATSNALQSSCR